MLTLMLQSGILDLDRSHTMFIKIELHSYMKVLAILEI